jgi:hypothetical protein
VLTTSPPSLRPHLASSLGQRRYVPLLPPVLFWPVIGRPLPLPYSHIHLLMSIPSFAFHICYLKLASTLRLRHACYLFQLSVPFYLTVVVIAVKISNQAASRHASLLTLALCSSERRMKANITWPCLSGSSKVLERLKLKQKSL